MVRNFLSLGLFLAVMVLHFTVISSTARAQSNIAVIDDQQILLHSDAAKSIKTQVKHIRESYLQTFSEEEKRLFAEEKNLIQERDSLSKEEFAKKVQAYEKRNIALQRLAQNKKHQLDRASMVAVDELRNILLDVVQELSIENGYQLVLTHKNVLLGEKSLDITQDVMKRVNKRVSTIDVKLDDESDAVTAPQQNAKTQINPQ